MTATKFLLAQVALTLVSLCALRRLLHHHWTALARLLLFVASAAFSFDYVANDRGIWEFHDGWHLRVIINPLENTFFSTTMAILLLLLYLGLANRIPRKNRLSGRLTPRPER